MREESKKEKLTREKIVSDIKNYYFQYAILAIGFSVMIIVFVGFLAVLDLSTEQKISMQTIWIFFVFLSMIVPSLGIYFYYLNLAKKGDFQIETDCVTNKLKTNTYSNIVVYFRSIFEKTHKLVFKSGRRYTLPDNIEYYKWTGWGMKHLQVYNSTEIGDEFYVVVTKKNKVLQIYNKKFFELTEK